MVALALKRNVYQIGILGMQFTQFSGKYKKVKADLRTFTAISQILTNLTGDEARLCLPRADNSLVTANALCCLVFCVARLAVDLVKQI